MSQILIDYQYAQMLGSRLEGFKQVRSRLWNCRCPICGDSAKRKSVKRFYIYQNHKNGTADHLSVACHNCGHQSSFSRFLESFDASLYQEYRLDLFKEMGWNTRSLVEPEKPQEAPVEATEEPIQVDGLDLPLISELDDGHFAKKYVVDRKLPLWTHDLLMYSNNFKKQLENFSVEASLMNLPNDTRLIIPFYDEYGNLKTIQGRALDPNSKLRYITLKKSESASKVFGLDRLDKSRLVLVVEGPIDSLFLPNCIATADGDLMSAGIGNLFIYDFQPRNPHVMKRLLDCIKKGHKVVIPPNEYPYKDINDMAKDGGMSTSDIVRFIGKYTYSGLAARMRFSQYCPLNTSSW